MPEMYDLDEVSLAYDERTTLTVPNELLEVIHGLMLHKDQPIYQTIDRAFRMLEEEGKLNKKAFWSSELEEGGE